MAVPTESLSAGYSEVNAEKSAAIQEEDPDEAESEVRGVRGSLAVSTAIASTRVAQCERAGLSVRYTAQAPMRERSCRSQTAIDYLKLRNGATVRKSRRRVRSGVRFGTQGPGCRVLMSA